MYPVPIELSLSSVRPIAYQFIFRSQFSSSFEYV